MTGDVVEYVLWVESFICPSCQADIVSDQVVRATEDIGTAVEFPCPKLWSISQQRTFSWLEGVSALRGGFERCSTRP